jgi:rubrerythrin
MYLASKRVAEFQGEKASETSFTEAMEAEKIHARLYQKAKQAVDGGEEIDSGSIQIC